MKIDAIFVQSSLKEFAANTGRGWGFLKSFQTAISDKQKPVYLFLEQGDFNGCLDVPNSIKEKFPFIKVVSVDDSFHFNKTSLVFSFLMRYKLNEFKKILLLETDCVLINGFDKFIEKEICDIDSDEWFILGSSHYGDSVRHYLERSGRAPCVEFDEVAIERLSQKKHMNGVAVYNRSEEFNSFFKKVFDHGSILNMSGNYDFYIYKFMELGGIYEKSCIDSQFIINISHRDDASTNWKALKPNAKIIHTKCKLTALKNVFAV